MESPLQGFKMELDMKPSEICKRYGLKSIVELSKLIGRSADLLTSWHKNYPLLFLSTVVGAATIKNGKHKVEADLRSFDSKTTLGKQSKELSFTMIVTVDNIEENVGKIKAIIENMITVKPEEKSNARIGNKNDESL